MEITSPGWLVSGVRIGAGLKAVKAKFSGKVSKEKGFEIYSGFIAEGYSNFFFRKGKLVKITAEFNFC